jgi:hypothetical protein
MTFKKLQMKSESLTEARYSNGSPKQLQQEFKIEMQLIWKLRFNFITIRPKSRSIIEKVENLSGNKKLILLKPSIE